MAIAIEPGKITVKLFGAKHSPTAYAIRDFLQRSVVAFEWIELQSDEEAHTLAQVENLLDRRLPIIDSLSCGFTSHLDNLVDRCNWACFLRTLSVR